MEFKCDICSKEFNRKKYLNKHLILHKEEKNYECGICGNKYKRSDHLRRHMIIHGDNPKPFSCTECVARFSNKCHLKRHFRMIHAEKKIVIKCKICDKEFTKKTKLNRHMFTHDKKLKTHKCYYPYCSKYYFKRAKLEKHIACAHLEVTNNQNGGNISLQQTNLGFPNIQLEEKDTNSVFTQSQSNFFSQVIKQEPIEVEVTFGNNAVNPDIMNYFNMSIHEEEFSDYKSLQGFGDFDYPENQAEAKVEEESNDLFEKFNTDLRKIDFSSLGGSEINYYTNERDYMSMAEIDEEKAKKVVNLQESLITQEMTIEKSVTQKTSESSAKKYLIKCPVEGCDKTYSTNYNLNTHIKTYHFKVREYKCTNEGCSSEFKHNCTLQKHKKKCSFTAEKTKNMTETEISKLIDRETQTC